MHRVMHACRCSCSWAAEGKARKAASKAEQELCREEEAVVMKLLAEGRMPVNDDTGGSSRRGSKQGGAGHMQ